MSEHTQEATLNQDKMGQGNMAHTPGPWRVRPAIQRRSPYPEIEAESGHVICDLRANGLNAPQKHGEANAMLISAAPDLLAALMEFIRIDEQSDLLAADGGELVSALHDARTAIAKATGGTGA